VGGISALQPGEVVKAQPASTDLIGYQMSSKDGQKPSQKRGNQ
jgi:hypothetical protein